LISSGASQIAMMYFLLAALIVAAAAAWTDGRTGHIPNGLTVGTLDIALVAHLAGGWKQGGVGAGFADLGWSFGGALFCTIVPGFMYWRGAIGGGDLKLF